LAYGVFTPEKQNVFFNNINLLHNLYNCYKFLYCSFSNRDGLLGEVSIIVWSQKH